MAANVRVSVELHIVPVLHFDADFDSPATVVLAIADPNCVELLPVRIVFKNREPRSGHVMDSLQSQPRPEPVQANSFDGAAGDMWRKFCGFHVKYVASVERHTRWRNPRPNCAIFIDDSNADPSVSDS